MNEDITSRPKNEEAGDHQSNNGQDQTLDQSAQSFESASAPDPNGHQDNPQPELDQSDLAAGQENEITSSVSDTPRIKKKTIFSRIFSIFSRNNHHDLPKTKRTGSVKAEPPLQINNELEQNAAIEKLEGVVVSQELIEAGTLETIRDLVKEEWAKQQELQIKASEEMLAEYFQVKQKAVLVEYHKKLTDALKSKVISLSQRLFLVRDQIIKTLKDTSIPVFEKIKMLDALRIEESKIEEEFQKLEDKLSELSGLTVRSNEVLETHSVIKDLRQELELQKQQIALFQAKANRKVSLPVIVAILVLIGIGTAGILYFNPFKFRDAENARLLIESASLYQSAGLPDDAERVLDDALALGVNDPVQLARAGELYRILRKYDKAINALVQASALSPNDETILLSLARSYTGAQKNPEAIARYQVLTQLNPEKTLYYIELGGRYRAINNPEMALAAYQKVVDINPRILEGYFFMGEVYFSQSNYQKAIEMYEKVLSINPNYYLALVNNGKSYIAIGDYEKGKQLYQSAIDAAPDRVEAYYYMGEAFMAQGIFDQAISYYDQTIAVNDKYIQAYVGLGKVYLVQNDCKNAVIQFRGALKLDPKNKEALQGVEACLQ